MLPQLIITVDELQNHETALNGRAWLLVFVSGFICGATAGLSALWFFAHWMHR